MLFLLIMHIYKPVDISRMIARQYHQPVKPLQTTQRFGLWAAADDAYHYLSVVVKPRRHEH